MGLCRRCATGGLDSGLAGPSNSRERRGFSRVALPDCQGPGLPRVSERSLPIQVLEESDLPAGPESHGSLSEEDIKQIHTALDQLPREHREVLVLRYLEEMSYDDIAQVIGCPLGTVRSRIHYAKIALRTALEKERRP